MLEISVAQSQQGSGSRSPSTAASQVCLWAAGWTSSRVRLRHRLLRGAMDSEQLRSRLLLRRRSARRACWPHKDQSMVAEGYSSRNALARDNAHSGPYRLVALRG